MKKILFIFSLILSININAQVPGDIPTIEIIIDGHKNIRDKLEKRKNQEARNSLLGEEVKKLSEKYRELRDSTAKRMATGYAYLSFAKEAADILQLLYKITPLITEYSQFAIQNGVKHPLIAKYYYKSYKGIKEEVETCTKMITFNSTLLQMTHKQKYDFLMQLKASLQIIQWQLERTLFMCQGVVGLNLSFEKSFAELMKDEEFKKFAKKAAEDIKNKF